MSPGGGATGLFPPSDEGSVAPLAGRGFLDDGSDGRKHSEVPTGRPMDLTERWNMAILVLLYMIQGIPLGLTTGAM